MGQGRLTRQQRRAAARGRRSATQSRIVWIALFAVAAIAAVAVILAGRGSGPVAVPEGVERFAVPSRFHAQRPVRYPQTPPVGGDHAGVWQNCGFYDAQIPNETGVHSLEHGALWITFRPDLPPPQVETLRRLARSQTFVLVSAFPDLPAAVVASAWGVQLRAESADDPRLAQFVRAFRLGPQTPELGAPCTQGIGNPG